MRRGRRGNQVLNPGSGINETPANTQETAGTAVQSRTNPEREDTQEVVARPRTGRYGDRLATVGRSSNGRANRERERVRRWLRARGGRGVNYARRQQYRRFSYAGRAALGSAGAALLGLVIASAGGTALGGVLLLAAVGLGLYARHWLSLAGRSRVGARSEDEVQRVLAPLEAEGWRLRHSLTWHAGGDIDSVAIAPTGIVVAIETKTRTYEARHVARVWEQADWLSQRRGRTKHVTSLECGSRPTGCRSAGEGGLATGRSASCAWFAPGASSESTRTCSLSRSTG